MGLHTHNWSAQAYYSRHSSGQIEQGLAVKDALKNSVYPHDPIVVVIISLLHPETANPEAWIFIPSFPSLHACPKIIPISTAQMR